MRAKWKRTFDSWVRPASSCRTRRGGGSVRNLLRCAPHSCGHLRKNSAGFWPCQGMAEWVLQERSNQLFMEWFANKQQSVPFGMELRQIKVKQFNINSFSRSGTVTLRNCQVTDTKPCFLAPKMGSLLCPFCWHLPRGARMAGPPPKNSWDCQFPTMPLTQRINDIPITLRTIPMMVKKTHPTQICTDEALNEQLPSKKTFTYISFCQFGKHVAFGTLWNLGGGGCKTSRRSFVCGTCQARGILYIVKFGKSGVQRCNPERVRKKIFLLSFTLIELHVCTPNFFLSTYWV